MYTIRTLRSRAVPHSPRLSQSPRFLSQVRPHPLAAKAPTPGAFKPRPQKWSSLTAILVATFTGSATYIFGLQSGMGAAKGSAPAGDAAKVYKDPTAAGFAKAMQQLRTELPQDCIAEDRETLVDHGHSKWSCESDPSILKRGCTDRNYAHVDHDPTGLPGAVLYPRSTEDVVKIVKLAALYSIPLVPFSGGTSLEGHTDALSYASNPGDKKVMEKKARGEKVVVDDLGAGLSWCLDFSENMGRIIAVHANDLDVVVQPGVSYDALNAQLKEDGVPLFFPVDPAPGAMIGGMVGTGASGTNAGRYGTMRENVINLTVVLASGEVIKVSPSQSSSLQFTDTPASRLDSVQRSALQVLIFQSSSSGAKVPLESSSKLPSSSSPASLRLSPSLPSPPFVSPPTLSAISCSRASVSPASSCSMTR
jgi:D-lactate dehydrogenase (cytochrome)